jgi:ribosomal protein S18 acetylase RimI-like enzyme
MSIEDYDGVFSLWRITSSRALSFSDEKEELNKFLLRNEGLSVVAVCDGEIIGTVLAGHDGRRGFIYHMAVSPSHRRMGIGKRLAETAIRNLSSAGISKTHIFVFNDNFTGQGFWSSLGWVLRDDLLVFASPQADSSGEVRV